MLNKEVPREVAAIEVTTYELVMKFDGTSMANSKGVGVVLYHRRETIVLSFKL